MNIQWYPGHMTKSVRMMKENLKLIDVVIELLDARIPYSSKNPDIDSLATNKKRIILLNKIDLANDSATKEWIKYYEDKGYKAIAINSISGKGVKDVTSAAMELMKETIEKDRQRGRIFRPVRGMIVGIPNVGKSAFINKYVGKATAKTGDKPGVTRGKQWIRIKKEFELLDTPGILWPKFEDQNVGYKLAYTGAINDNILDQSELGCRFIELIRNKDEKIIKERYGIEISNEEENHVILEKIALKRGIIKKKNEADLERCGRTILEDFRSGRLGRLTIETPKSIEEEKNIN